MIPAVSERRPEVVLTDPTSSFACDYVSGVNRVLSLDSYLLIDNIARNVEVWEFGRDAGETPVGRSRAASASAIPWRRCWTSTCTRPSCRKPADDCGESLRSRAGSTCRPSGGVPADFRAPALGDTERVLFARLFHRIVARGKYGRPGAAGCSSSSPWPDRRTRQANRLTRRDARHDQALADWDVISAIDVPADGQSLAVASGGVCSRCCGLPQAASGRGRWETEVPISASGSLDAAHRLWTSGVVRCLMPAAMTGTHAGAAAPPPSMTKARVSFPICRTTPPGATVIRRISSDLQRLFTLAAADHDKLDLDAAHKWCLYAGSRRRPTTSRLGIGHAALREIYAGFSRGYRLMRYDVGAKPDVRG